jgi:hypothetical protein
VRADHNARSAVFFDAIDIAGPALINQAHLEEAELKRMLKRWPFDTMPVAAYRWPDYRLIGLTCEGSAAIIVHAWED